MTMRISYITAARMPTEKAHGISIAHMCASFAATGAEVELVVPDRRNAIRENLFAFYGVPESFSTRFIHVPDFVGRGWTHPIFFFLQRIFFAQAAKRAVEQGSVVYTREPEIVRVFAKTHTVVYEAHRIPRGIRGSLTGRLIRGAALVVCNSRGTEAAVRALGIERTLVAPNGFDPKQFADAMRPRAELGLPEGMLALYAGSDAPWKGIRVVREAAQSLSGVSIAVVGGGQVLREGRLTEIGRVKPDLVPAYVRSADILLLPNTAANEESEHFTSPIKLFEYLAAEKPIIASDLPSIREILGPEDALFVPAGDGEALARAIEQLAGDASLRARLAEASHRLADAYTWQKRAARILSAL